MARTGRRSESYGLVHRDAARGLRQDNAERGERERDSSACHPNPAIPRGSVFVGGAMSNDSIEDLRRKAAGLGGNLVLVTMEPPRVSGNGFGTYFVATVFRCEGA